MNNVPSGSTFQIESGATFKTDSIAEYTGANGVGFTSRLTTTDGVASGTARVVGGLAKSGVSAIDTVLATASNNSFVSFATNYSIPASTIGIGTVIYVRSVVVVNDASGTDTLTCNILLGSTSLIATTAVDPTTTSDVHIMEFWLTGRAASGAAAAIVGDGRWITNTAGTIAHGTGLLATTNFTTSGALVLSSQAKWSSNTGSTSARLESFRVFVY